MRRADGFTLLELLVSLALLVVLAAALYSTWFALERGRDRAAAGLEQWRELRTTLDLLRRELSATLYRRDNNRLVFIVEDRDHFGQPASTLEFTAVAPPRVDNQPASDQVRLRYRLLPREGELLLVREGRDAYRETEPLPYPQMAAVEGFLVECFDGSKWVRSWDTRLTSVLPKQVRVSITFRDGEKTATFASLAIPRIAGQ